MSSESAAKVKFPGVVMMLLTVLLFLFSVVSQ